MMSHKKEIIEKRLTDRIGQREVTLHIRENISLKIDSFTNASFNLIANKS